MTVEMRLRRLEARMDRLEVALRPVADVRTVERRQVREWSPGDKVQFRSRKGRLIVGEIEKLNKKTVGFVEEGTGRKWRVSPAYLEARDDG